MSKAETKPIADTIPLEQDLLKLEETVRALEGSGLPLEKLLEHYEEGIRVYRRCHTKLKDAQLRVEAIRVDAEGRPILEPFDHQSSIESARGSLRKTRVGED